MLSFADPALEARYREEGPANGRLFSRIVLALLVLVFDLFFLFELRDAPEILPLSAVLRFALLTPLAVLFVWLDARDRLHRGYEAVTTVLLVLPTLCACVEIIFITSRSALPIIQAIPLIMLGGLTSRHAVPYVTVAVLISCLAFIGGVSLSAAVPAMFHASMILTDLAIGIAVVAFAIRVELRERRVFLLVQTAESARASLAEQNRGLLEESHTDALTGCANRRRFDEVVAASWESARRERRPVGLILFDIDHFKAYNDHYGHNAGDECLWLVATRAMGEVAEGDLLARYGGEEFAVVMPGAPAWRVDQVAASMRAAIAGMGIPHEGLGPGAVVTISLGAATLVPDDGNDRRALFEAADRRLYAAKRGGRDRAVGSAGVAAREHSSV